MNTRNQNSTNQYNQPQGDNKLMYLVAIVMVSVAGYYALNMGMFGIKGFKFKENSEKDPKESPKKDFKERPKKDFIELSKKDFKESSKLLETYMCSLDCSSIPGSSCVNGKCTDPYLFLQRL